MTVVSLVVAPWLRCRRHKAEFVDRDPAWRQAGHEDCVLDPSVRVQTIVLVGEDYDSRYPNLRMFMCRSCSGQGLYIRHGARIFHDPDTHETYPENPADWVAPCDECGGYGYS